MVSVQEFPGDFLSVLTIDPIGGNDWSRAASFGAGFQRDVHAAEVGFGTEDIDGQCVAIDAGQDINVVRQVVVELEIKLSIGNGGVQTGSDIAGWIKMRSSDGGLQVGQQDCIIKGGTDLADTAANILGNFSIEDYGGTAIAGGGNPVSDRVVEREICIAFDENVVECVGSDIDIGAAAGVATVEMGREAG